MSPSPSVQPPDTDANAILAGMLSHPGFVLALRERRRLAEEPGFDAQQDGMQLAKGAACFLRQAILLTTQGAGAAPGQPFTDWPWPAGTWKPPHAAEEALVKAMALIAAELDLILMGKAREAAAVRVDRAP